MVYVQIIILSFIETFCQIKISVKGEPKLKDEGKRIYSKENGNISLTYAVEKTPINNNSKMQISVENNENGFSRLCTIHFPNNGNTTCDYDIGTISELIKSYKDRVEFLYKSNDNIYFGLKQLKPSDFGKKYKYDYKYDLFNRQDVSVELVEAGRSIGKNCQAFKNFLIRNLQKQASRGVLMKRCS